VMIGLGGVMAEILDDSVFAVAPLSRRDALGMIGRLKRQTLLNGFRGSAAVDRGALADALIRLADIGSRWPAIREIDINPLVVSAGSPMAVDATVVLKE